MKVVITVVKIFMMVVNSVRELSFDIIASLIHDN
jgi:hypothetical protein